MEILFGVWCWYYYHRALEYTTIPYQILRHRHHQAANHNIKKEELQEKERTGRCVLATVAVPRNREYN
eukprot:scaffold34632_cov168-Amphora_coffeaeformis.AAC.3